MSDINYSLHGGLMLRSVRTIYNIFLLSKATSVQTLAQASLSQIQNQIFTRIPRNILFTDIMKHHPSQLGSKKQQQPVRPLKSESLESIPQSDPFDIPTGNVDALGNKHANARASQDILEEARENIVKLESEYDVACKDAYLLFRAFCKLTMKTVTAAESYIY
jgi:brefeldin A-inhibited guanine nucleotide-exchange protein